MSSGSYEKAARILGWKWSSAHDGLISENHRNGPEWKDYFVALDAEDACFQDGIENDGQADAFVRRHEAEQAA